MQISRKSVTRSKENIQDSTSCQTQGAFLSRTDHTGVAPGVFLEFHWPICPEALSVRTDLVWVGWSEHRVHLKNNIKEY